MSTAAMMLVQAAEARRRRDEKGRYMGDDQESQYAGYSAMDRGGQGNNQYSRERQNTMDGGAGMRDGTGMRMGYAAGEYGADMRRGRRRNEMRQSDGGQVERVNRRMEDDDEDEMQMGGEGYFAWDRMSPPWHLPPDRYGQPGEMRYDDNNVTDMRTYNRRRSVMEPASHMGRDERWWGMEKQGRIGFGERDGHDEEFRGGRMTREKAEKWIRSMKNPEGKPLQIVPYSEIQRVAPNYGVDGEHKMVEFWVVVNMVKSDYQDVGKKYAGDAVDFYAALAKDWLEDKDAVDDKLAMYKRYIVEKDD